MRRIARPSAQRAHGPRASGCGQRRPPQDPIGCAACGLVRYVASVSGCVSQLLRGVHAHGCEPLRRTSRSAHRAAALPVDARVCRGVCPDRRQSARAFVHLRHDVPSVRRNVRGVHAVVHGLWGHARVRRCVSALRRPMSTCSGVERRCKKPSALRWAPCVDGSGPTHSRHPAVQLRVETADPAKRGGDHGDSTRSSACAAPACSTRTTACQAARHRRARAWCNCTDRRDWWIRTCRAEAHASHRVPGRQAETFLRATWKQRYFGYRRAGGTAETLGAWVTRRSSGKWRA